MIQIRYARLWHQKSLTYTWRQHQQTLNELDSHQWIGCHQDVFWLFCFILFPCCLSSTAQAWLEGAQVSEHGRVTAGRIFGHSAGAGCSRWDGGNHVGTCILRKDIFWQTYIYHIYIYIENIIYLSKFLSIYLPTNQPINQSIIHYMPGSFEFNFGDSQFEPGVQSY